MTHYYELRVLPHQPAPTLGADIARHLEARQDLGKAIVVAHTPAVQLSVVRKQWFHLARHLQRQRASTLNSEEILRLTHTIMHMQRMQFVAKTPHETPDADVYFVKPDALRTLPPQCHTIYLTAPIKPKTLQQCMEFAPNHCLVVNYDTGVPFDELSLSPKAELETKVIHEWQEVVSFLQQHHINPQNFASQNPAQFGALDDALDILLNYSHQFLRLASSFRQTIHLAQPLTTISAEQQQLFTAVMRLAYRVQTLSPDSFNTYLLKTFGEKESYFLRDHGVNPVWMFFALPCLPELEAT